MLATLTRTSVAAVNEGVGSDIAARRTRLGLSVRALADLAGVDRGRLAKIESGEAQNVRPATLGAIESALAAKEAVRGGSVARNVRQIGEPSEGLYELAIEGTDIRVVVKGPIRDAKKLEESALRLIRAAQADAAAAAKGRTSP